MTERSVKHASFVIERTYDAPPARVFAAFADPAIKRRWFAEGEGWEIEEFNADFRVGNSERSRSRFRGGELIRNDTIYQDIVSRPTHHHHLLHDDRRQPDFRFADDHGVHAGGFGYAPGLHRAGRLPRRIR